MWYINDDRSLTPHLIGIDAVASVLAVSWLPKMFRCNCGPDVLVVLDSRGCIQVFEESFSCSDLKFRKRDRFPLKTCSAASPERPLSYGIVTKYDPLGDQLNDGSEKPTAWCTTVGSFGSFGLNLAIVVSLLIHVAYISHPRTISALSSHS